MLTKNKTVLHRLKRLCTETIDSASKRIFGSDGSELRDAVERYRACRYENPNREDAEGIANTYGWPIGKWDVSQVRNFRSTFHSFVAFNEDVLLWDTSRATDMHHMFDGAATFNQDISS